MRELLDILAAVERLDATSSSAVLATVVRVDGSSYRLPGARLLIDAAGVRTGSVSGGCLEADVARRGRLLSADDPPALVHYDGSDEDAVWGFGLGCNGSIDVLIERLGDQAARSLEFIRHCIDRPSAGVLITVYQVDGNAAGYRAGDRWMLDDADGAAVPEALRPAAVDCLGDGQTSTVICECTTGGRVHALVESIRPPLPLVIFGAGHDAVPLVRAAKQLGWHVTVCDRRPGYARGERFPLADVVVALPLETMLDQLRLTVDTVAVTMTHHFPDDRALLEMLLRSPARFVGALGPRARTQRILEDLAESGFHPTREQLDRLHAPVGLDVGAEGPEQVALAIVAEIVSTLNRRAGASLRDRVGPIHVPAILRLITAVQPAPAQASR